MLGTMSFERTDVKINGEEVNYWKRMIRSNLKIGVEIETNIDRSIGNSTVRDELKRILNPTGDYGVFGDYGVITIKGDGSLDNGIELCTTGRRVSFIDLYNQYSAIIAHIMRFKPIMNERAGLHNHMMMDWGSGYNSLEKPFPAVVFKNFVQLLKRHMPELVWITSTVNTVYEGVQYLTRMERFCSGDTLVKTTPLTRTVREFKDKVMYCERYKFLNLNPMQVSGDVIDKFHVELRFPDGSLYPAQIAAQNILYSAILLKAVELSECGIINCGNAELWEETKTLYNSIRNPELYNDRDIRLSEPPTLEQQIRIKERAKDMLLEFKAQIDSFDNHTFMVLSMLAENPISILRRTMNDLQVNELFSTTIQNMYTTDLSECAKVLEIINLNKITKCFSEDNWCHTVAQKTSTDISKVKADLFKLGLVKQLQFDKIIGSYIFK